MLSPTVTLKKSLIDYKATGLFSSLISDYLSGDARLRDFYQYERNIASFKQAIENRKKFPVYRRQLTATLRNQHHQFQNDFPLVDKNIALLEKENTFTVTTGHQLNIFTGPLYYIYKIISTINLAEALKKEYPSYDFVPVHWMNGEDHDFEEINHINIFNSKLEWKQENHGPAGKLTTDSMADVLKELKNLMGAGENADELFKLFEEAYLFNSTLASAARFLLTRLFGKYGLVVIDGDDKELKNLFKPVIKSELEKQLSFAKVEEASVALTKIGYKTQVHPREINLFYMANGIRERIVKNSSGKFEVMNSDLVFDKDEMMAMVESNPENFSPNVVLRPLYQEYILPNLAFVGGPGELAYWLQYRSMFAMHNVHYPVLIFRSSAIFMDNKSMRRTEALNITLADLFKPMDALSSLYISKLDESNLDFEDEKKSLQKVFDDLKLKITAIDKSLENTVAAELQKTINAVETLQKKANAAMKRKHETAITQLKNLQEKLLPKGVFQERHVNFIPYYLQYGNLFIGMLKEQLPVFEDKIVLLEEAV